jgi:hypothetical protein
VALLVVVQTVSDDDDDDDDGGGEQGICSACCLLVLFELNGYSSHHKIFIFELFSSSTSSSSSTMSNRKTAKGKAANDAADDDNVRRNDKGEICSWTSTGDDGRLLRMLVENGNIKTGLTAGDARKKYPMFNKYSYNCFSSALTNTRKSLGTEVEAREEQTGRGGKSGRLQAYSNLNNKKGYDDDDDDDDDETYKQMSKMSVNDDDDDSYRGGGAKSVSFNNCSSGRSIRSTVSRQQGTTSTSALARGTPPRTPATAANKARPLHCALPYIIEYWHDLRPQQRASVQVQMLTMSPELMKRVTYRVSTGRNELVILIPVSTYFGAPEAAFNFYVLHSGMDDTEVERHTQSLQYHPKSVQRRIHLSKLRAKHGASANTLLELRIPLKGSYSLDFATPHNNDPYFHGEKLIQYPDGTFFLHAELVADSVEGTTNPLDRNSSAMVMLCGAAPPNPDNIPGSVSVPSGGDDDACSLMDITVHSTAVHSTGARTTATTGTARSATARTCALVACGTLAVASPPGVVGTTPTIIQHHPLALFAENDAQSVAFSGGGGSYQDARSVKSRMTSATTSPSNKTNKTKRKLRSNGGTVRTSTGTVVNSTTGRASGDGILVVNKASGAGYDGGGGVVL